MTKAMLYGAPSERHLPARHRKDRPNLLSRQDGSEQFRPAIPSSLGNHDAGDEHFFSLFQVL